MLYSLFVIRHWVFVIRYDSIARNQAFTIVLKLSRRTCPEVHPKDLS